MKLIKISIAFILLLSISLQSCLDLDPKADLAETNLWKNAEHYRLFASQFYGWTRDFKSMDASIHWDGRSDLVTASTTDIYSNGTNTIPISDNDIIPYKDIYNKIRQANILLEKSESYAIPTDIKTYVGEAKFFRAYLYFELLQLFGDVIIVKKTLDITSPELKTARNPRSEVVDFIIEDLQDAILKLPAHKTISTSEAGRVSSEAASAFLSRVALYEGTWQKSRNNETRGKALLDVAAIAAKDVIDSETFALFNPEELGTQSYKYLFILENVQSNPANIGKTANKEYIFARRHDESINAIGYNITKGRFANSGVNFITRKMTNMYLQSNGLPVNPSTWDYSKMDSEFKNRDNRMTNSLMVAGKTYWSNAGARVTWAGDTEDIASAAIKSLNPVYGSGYQNQKWATERLVADTREGYDFPIIRYAEVLLNYAEAVFERDQNISDEDLNISLNLVRLRVNPDMPKLSNNFVSVNGLDMRTEIRRERTVELFDEGFRLDDLKRWKTAEVEMPMDLLGVKWLGTEFQTKWPNVSYSKNSDGCLILETGRKWEQKNYLLPLPADQVQLNPNLGNNPGWN
ncbi:RagB/SusD family nutrient uptake outer membrane protein [Dysgonomonas sp. BGC7]|uniref:RagB/SusD family nutrient uptake outer membrane protein n=1 Tax=Dysgonomonas sp. BGC7 TaxID=1658008 RepID=UPI000681A0E6|nr:RagB/SusD family nutrient uptake outer membrane protein [Dysgonomonas sp. BGC7]MBD8388943.1 RagB/SusD family nutrient uptake outer membrane protein [Dysgonomonas sp. BGC7]